MKKVLVIFFLFCALFIVGQEDKLIDSLKRLLAGNLPDTTIYNLNSNLAMTYYNKKNLDSALVYSNKVLSQCPDKYDKFKAQSYSVRGYYYRLNFNFDSAFHYIVKALRIYLRDKNYRAMGSTTNNLGLLFDGYGKWNRAIEFYRISAALLNFTGEKYKEGNSFNNIGTIYETIGDYSKSLENHFKAYSLYTESNYVLGISRSANNIGNVYADQKQYSKAIEYYRKSSQALTKEDDKQGMYEGFINLGVVYSEMGLYDSAVSNYSYAENLVIGSKFEPMIANLYDNRGALEDKRGNHVLAEEYFKKGLKIATETGDSVQIAYSISSLASNLLLQKKFNEAETQLKLAYQIASRSEISELSVSTLQSLTSLYEQLNKPGEAFRYYKEFIAEKEKQKIDESKRVADRKELKFDYDKQVYELKEEQEKRELIQQEEKLRQNIITLSIAIVCMLIIVFSIVLYKRFKESEKQKQIIANQKNEVERQKEIVDEKQKAIVDSINYAKRIQQTLLAHDNFLQKNLSEYFVLFKPKDIVSGDFYWATKKGDAFYIAVCDSTGHGVPGAFMSLLNINFLNEAINEKNIREPNLVFDHVRQGLIQNISQEGQKDGMDGILLCIQNGKLTYASANNAPVVISENGIIEQSKDKMPVGIGERKDPFRLFEINTIKGDMIYLYTDGFADQFGGVKGKKFKYKPLNELLLSISSLTVEEQKQKLDAAFESWRGDLEQVDDVCIIGIRI